MINKPEIIFVSLAGVGGCSISKALRSLGQNGYPFDWLIARQDFVISAIESNGKHFFDFDNPQRLHGDTVITTTDNNALSIHDFKNNWLIEKDDVKKKYKRRWMRLNNILNSIQQSQSPQKIIFIRSFLDMDEPIESIYDNIFLRREENVKLWEEFLCRLKEKNPNKEMDIIILTSRKDLKSDVPNVHVITMDNYKDHKEIKKVLKGFLPLGHRYMYLVMKLRYLLKKLYFNIVINFFSKPKTQANRS